MKIYTLTQVFIANGSTFPFKAQWHEPGAKDHGLVVTILGRHPKNSEYFATAKPDHAVERISNPSKGIGWNAVSAPKLSLNDVLALCHTKETT